MSSHSLGLSEGSGSLFFFLCGWLADKRLFICICPISHKFCGFMFKVGSVLKPGLLPDHGLPCAFQCRRTTARHRCTLHFNPTKDKNNDWKCFCAKAFTHFHFAASCTLGVSASWVRPLSSYCILNDLHQATLTKPRKIRRQQMMSQPRSFIRDGKW